MPNPARETTAGRIHNDLRNLARRSGAPTDQVRGLAWLPAERVWRAR
jgi:hypothetical protein